ncbi:alcohol dehydrogenase catalytic domain-containing protein [Streptomyces sp. R302]|uniref:alcohol dehydrogenase catalytic domain-containing protein n=1 Tax=unclassified Streptomyces TaxID=2593676 RepID=UPI00145F0CAB|nr:alcohol dehydrogenase catalytic domain-containing protein [Streptomyces sp. R301]NML80795.1 alcohol dehydrogenase catalytic domain-containing protein [Streptomyces sp. R302]
MSPRGKAVVLDAPGTARLVAHTPRRPGPGEALVRVHAVGMCGSDRDVYLGRRPAPYVRYPLTPGHEWSGTVTDVGEGAPASLIGRKVVGEGLRNCETCAPCRAGETNLCAAGYDETGFTLPGAMAPTLTLPARLLHTLPPDADLTAAAFLEPAACAAAAVLKASPLPGSRVAVVGSGALGLLAAQLLGAFSPSELTVVGTSPGRAGLADRFGATAYRTWDHSSGLAGFDAVIDAVGARSTARAAASLLRPGGRLVLTGIPVHGAERLDPARVVARQLSIGTALGASSGAWSYAVRAFSAARLTPLELLTHQLGVEEFERAMDLTGSGDVRVGKVLLLP